MKATENDRQKGCQGVILNVYQKLKTPMVLSITSAHANGKGVIGLDYRVVKFVHSSLSALALNPAGHFERTWGGMVATIARDSSEASIVLLSFTSGEVNPVFKLSLDLVNKMLEILPIVETMMSEN